MGGQPAAPIGSRTQRKGVVGVEKDSVLVENRPVSYVSAPHSCRVHGRNKIGKGAKNVLVYNKPIARVTDKATCGCKIVKEFAPSVLIGEATESIKKWLWGDDANVTYYGKGIRIVGSEAFVKHVVKELDQLKKIPTGRKILERVDDAKLRKSGRITIWEQAPPTPKGPLCDSAGALPVKVTDKEGTKKAIDAITKAPPEKQMEALDYMDRTDPKQVEVIPGEPWGVRVTQPGLGVAADHIAVSDDPRCRPACIAPPEFGPSGAPSPAAVLPRYLALGHELLHAIHFMEGKDLSIFPNPGELGSNLEEAQTMGTGAYARDPMTENAMRDEIGFPRRAGHYTLCPSALMMGFIK